MNQGKIDVDLMYDVKIDFEKFGLNQQQKKKFLERSHGTKVSGQASSSTRTAQGFMTKPQWPGLSIRNSWSFYSI